MALDSLFHFALKPDGIYGRVLRFFLTIILPMTVIASFPARLVFGKITWWEIVWSFVATGIMLAVSRVLWKYGLKRYESASS
ncbi:MAG: hypothetical protein HPY52_00330 [Firmicutes bacterium]|nr:hypothetical protein [Bacillota bacterium]